MTVLGIALWLAPDTGAMAAACTEGVTPDWMMSVPLNDSAAPVRPADCANVGQTPPDFGWPNADSSAQYRLTLTYPDGRSRTKTVAQNWHNWNEVLPAGTYSWKVEKITTTGTVGSRARTFMVGADAVPFLVPDPTTLLDRVTAKAHPRGMPEATTFATMRGQRQSAIKLLLGRVNSDLSSPLPGDSSSAANAESWRTLNSLMAYAYTKQDVYFNEALRRVLNLASWDSRGATSYLKDDWPSPRWVAWPLALGYDWLSPRMTSTQKNRVLSALKVRLGDVYNDLVASRRLATQPHNSHGDQNLHLLAVMSILLAGDLPEANIWLTESVPLSLNTLNPWGGEDGGFGNADNYGTWNVGELLGPWYILRWATGIDVGQKAWVRNWGKFATYFLPPGTPAGVFGDGAEQALDEAWARFGKGYTYFAPSPLRRWYASQLTGEDPTRIEYLLAPPADFTSATFPADTLSSMLFRSIGQVAMHSNLSDPARTSVYFKSSYYGSYNHSHADQNSFVINARGRRLAIDSGYYDGYGTPHWWKWYKQTRAHNAITFDGGQGQVVFEESGKLGSGAITGYVSQPDYDIVHGDATQAYGGALREAKRSLVYLRPNLILVYDALASEQARQWEWNIHALNRMEPAGDRQVTIRNGGASLCVEMLAGPPMRFTQNDRFSAAPQGPNMPQQWHGAFVNRDRSTATEFVALMRAGCPATKANARKVDGVWTVVVDSRTTITIATDSKDPNSRIRVHRSPPRSQ